MNYVLAVSGGVDSVALLDMVTRGQYLTDADEVIVAHFDHGIRPDSAADARFVAALAAQYGLEFVGERVELGARASEERARTARYDSLLRVAQKYQAQLVTAHHQDDLVETIALNLHRGTGWRGLAVLGRTEITRPLLGMSKLDIYKYACEQRLEWVEDATNRDQCYMRNRLRARLVGSDVDKSQLAQLREQQLMLREQIDTETARLLNSPATLSRYFLTQIDEKCAIELLRAQCLAVAGVAPTRPHLMRALIAAKTARPGTVHALGSGLIIAILRQSVAIKRSPDLI